MKNFNGPFCEKLLVSVTKKVKKKKKKKDRDPTISAVTNIHTRFYFQIREYPSTRILAAALKSIAECFPWSILQYFWPSLSYNSSLWSLLCLFLGGHFTQVFLYPQMPLINANADVSRQNRRLIFVPAFIYIHTLCTWETKALMSLQICTDSPQPLLLLLR